MKKSLRLAPLVWLLWIGDAQAGCEPRIEPIEVSKVEKSELKSVVIDPPAGTELRKDSMLTIDLEYRIADFSAGQFKLVPLFKTGVNRSKSFDVDGKDPDVRIESAAGRVRMCVPLAGLYGADAESVFWPLELHVTMLKADGVGRRRGVAASKPIKLNSVDMPRAALDRQAKAPPPEYEDALEYTFNHFVRHSALYKTCLQRLPPMQAKLTPAYRTWEARHKADIDFVSELQFEAMKAQYQGRSDAAMSVIDHIAEAQQQAYASLNADHLRHSCEEIVAQMNPQDDHTTDLLADHLAILRKWHARK
jgi:hypothetical protein